MTPEPSGKPGAPSSLPEDAGVRVVQVAPRGAWRLPLSLTILVVVLVGGMGWVLWPAAPRGARPASTPQGMLQTDPDTTAVARTSGLPSSQPLRPAPDAPESMVQGRRGDALLEGTELNATPAAADPNDLARYIRPGDPEPSMAEVIHALRESGDREGIAAFNPPGTRPPLVGLVVPEDYALPPGYVRHHQVTDAGEPLEPILMYAPDAQLLDAAGNPVPIPEDRVVPPERAPPGLPIRQVEIPPSPGG